MRPVWSRSGDPRASPRIYRDFTAGGHSHAARVDRTERAFAIGADGRAVCMDNKLVDAHLAGGDLAGVVFAQPLEEEGTGSTNAALHLYRRTRSPIHSFASLLLPVPPALAPICTSVRVRPWAAAACCSRTRCCFSEGLSQRHLFRSFAKNCTRVTSDRLRMSTVALRNGCGGWHARGSSAGDGNDWKEAHASRASADWSGVAMVHAAASQPRRRGRKRDGPCGVASHGTRRA